MFCIQITERRYDSEKKKKKKKKKQGDLSFFDFHCEPPHLMKLPRRTQPFFEKKKRNQTVLNNV